jgi:hypothetical protein
MKVAADEEELAEKFEAFSMTDVSVFETEVSFLKYVAGMHPTQWPSIITARVAFLDAEYETTVGEAVLNLSHTFAERGFAIVDSGATSSSEPHATLFSTMDTSVDLPVNTAGGTIKADGLGRVKWSLLDADDKTLQLCVDNALHLKQAERLLSVFQCVKQGHSVVFSPDASFLKLKGGRKIPFSVQGKYWVVKLQDTSEAAVEYCLWKRVQAKPISTTLAHRRLGHASEWSMRIMKQLNLIKGIDWQGPFPHNCSICREYSFQQASEQKSRDKSDEPGQLVAFDFWIPPKSQSALYSVKAMLGFRDDGTGMPWVYPVASKADLVKQCDVWYQAEVAPLKHVTLVECCCDHENVNLTEAAREWFADKGVKFVPSPPHMKGRTNIIESLWRPILSTTRAMLGDQDVQSFYFPATVVKATKLKQILPSKANVGCSSPYVLWHRKIPFGGYLRVWGSRCSVKDFSVKNKLEQQAHGGRFMADDESSAWKVMLDKTKKMVMSPHVRFDERSAAQRGLDDQVDFMTKVRDHEQASINRHDDLVIDKLVQAPRGEVPKIKSEPDLDVKTVSFAPDVRSEVHDDDQNTLLENRPVPLRRSGRVRNAPDQYRAEAGGRSNVEDRTRAERQALQSQSDLVNLHVW